eukprot:2508017-Amphidinium_carterae.1
MSWVEKIGRGKASNGVKAALWNALQHNVVTDLEYVIVLYDVYHAEQNVGMRKAEQWAALDRAIGVDSCKLEKLTELSVFTTNFDQWFEKKRTSSTGIRQTAIEVLNNVVVCGSCCAGGAGSSTEAQTIQSWCACLRQACGMVMEMKLEAFEASLAASRASTEGSLAAQVCAILASYLCTFTFCTPIHVRLHKGILTGCAYGAAAAATAATQAALPPDIGPSVTERAMHFTLTCAILALK